MRRDASSFLSADIFEAFAESTGYGAIHAARLFGLNSEGRADGWHLVPKSNQEETNARVRRWRARNLERAREMGRQYLARRYREDAAFKARKVREWSARGHAWAKANRALVNERMRERYRQLPEVREATLARVRRYRQRKAAAA